MNIIDILKQNGYEVIDERDMKYFRLKFTEDRLGKMRSSQAKYGYDIEGTFALRIDEVGFDWNGDLYVALETIGDEHFGPGRCFDVITVSGHEKK